MLVPRTLSQQQFKRSPLHARALPPLEKPPQPEHLPLPPTPPVSVDPVISKHFHVSTHLVPAAYPRLTPYVPAVPLPTFSKDKAQYKASVEKTLDGIMGWRMKQWSGELDHMPPNRNLLWNCIKRFVRKESSRGSGSPVTLFVAHSNGFPKEMWEPALAHLIAENARSANPVNIAEIWLWESINHGDSALVNDYNSMGGLYDWADNTRDMLNFLLSYLPNDPSVKKLPTHLPRLPTKLAASRQYFGFQSRALASIGHSFGGCSSLRAALECPQLFSSMVLVDPIISPWRKGTELLPERPVRMARGAIKRRSHWASKEEALRLLQQSPFFGVWDPAALKSYVDHGMCEDPQGGVRLKTSGTLEGIVFSEALASCEAWHLAEDLDPSIELRWIQPEFPMIECVSTRRVPAGADERVFVSSDIPKDHMVWLRPENSSNVIIPGSSHLIPHEKPRELAHDLLGFYSRKYARVRRPVAVRQDAPMPSLYAN
ncbi:hypothetical protein PHLGIDRAFT_25908 [Phlebiopsis gigantea 11061_1 CR5-6]|uniref:AB hydrolase-1 domain-containing protein n=1 Tax=Phlebiopsis gigantea (strain 11061_1 CR5-6) TaxID=745531 RepID=A0A0C3S621_PHLG1|nr:hypothetical protein PHLGIDRAFT_25908 [Phlebiopsis gigantea 11061_1 CR5-6]